MSLVVKKALQHDQLPSWLQYLVAGSLGLIFVLLPFHAFLSTWGGTAIGPLEAWKSWKEILLLLVSITLLVWLLVRPARFKRLTQDPLAWWVLAFFFGLLWLSLTHIGSSGAAATFAGIAMDGRYLLGFMLAYVLFFYGKWNWVAVRHWLARYLVIVASVVAILGIVQVFFLPHDFLSHFGYDKDVTIAPYTLIDQNESAPRAFATLRGPNDFGAFLILPLALCIIGARKYKWLLAIAALLLITLYLSASRSAWIGTGIMGAALVGITYGRAALRSWKVLLGFGVGIVLISGLLVSAMMIPSLRLSIFHSSPGDTSLTEGSTDEHWAATSAGLMRVIQHPFGCGGGCAGPASYYGASPRISENYYVQIAEEMGLAGIILWVGVVVMIAGRLWRHRADWLAVALLASLTGISVIGLWLHVWADDPLSITWWLLAGALLGAYAHPLYDKQKRDNKIEKINTRHDRQTKKEITTARR